jgi:hypothetical protein
MRNAIEALFLVTSLTAISLAMIALSDLFTTPMSLWRKFGWFLLVLCLPLVGPILYYRRAAQAPQRKRRTGSTQKKGR